MGRRGLGRGLGALFASDEKEDSKKDIYEEEIENSSESKNLEISHTPSGTSFIGDSKTSPSFQSNKLVTDGKLQEDNKAHTTVSEKSASVHISPNKKTDEKAYEKASSKKNGKVTKMRQWEDVGTPIDIFFSNTNKNSQAKGGADFENQLSEQSLSQSVSNEAKTPSASDSSSSGQVSPIKDAYFEEIPVNVIQSNPYQPRTVFNQEELEELKQSIEEVGVLQPIVVRRLTSEDVTTQNDSGVTATYELVMGERRLRASQMAGLESIPAIVKTTQSDNNMLRDALLENLQRVQLNPLEEAAAYQQMMQEFNLSQQALSDSLAKSRPYIANSLRLLQLPAPVQKQLESGLLSAGHARTLLGLKNPAEMIDLANRIIAEGLSVRTVEDIVSSHKISGKKATSLKSNKSSYWEQSDFPQQLEDYFETRIKFHGNQKKGKIEITYSSPEDLHRITDLLMSK